MNLAIAIGISIDAVIATAARFPRMTSLRFALRWALAIGLTHWLFPLAGFIIAWQVGVAFDVRPLVFAAGALIMAVLIVHVVKEGVTEVEVSVPTQSAAIWPAVLAVSIDALASGPGKVAAAAEWSSAQVWVSFPLVGAAVFAIVLTAALATHWFAHFLAKHAAPGGHLGALFHLGAVLEISVFSFFLWLSVIEAGRGFGLIASSRLPWFEAAATAALASMGLKRHRNQMGSDVGSRLQH
jgi:hypothetical protein